MYKSDNQFYLQNSLNLRFSGDVITAQTPTLWHRVTGNPQKLGMAQHINKNFENSINMIK